MLGYVRACAADVSHTPFGEGLAGPPTKVRVELSVGRLVGRRHRGILPLGLWTLWQVFLAWLHGYSHAHAAPA